MRMKGKGLKKEPQHRGLAGVEKDDPVTAVLHGEEEDLGRGHGAGPGDRREGRELESGNPMAQGAKEAKSVATTKGSDLTTRLTLPFSRKLRARHKITAE
jgi:hypothetical protein